MVSSPTLQLKADFHTTEEDSLLTTSRHPSSSSTQPKRTHRAAPKACTDLSPTGAGATRMRTGKHPTGGLLTTAALFSFAATCGLVPTTLVSASVADGLAPVPQDLREFSGLKLATEEWINGTNATGVVPFQRGAWLYGDYKTEIPNIPDIETCRQACAADSFCFHWVWRITDKRCDFHKMEGEFTEDVDDSIVGHVGHRRELQADQGDTVRNSKAKTTTTEGKSVTRTSETSGEAATQGTSAGVEVEAEESSVDERSQDYL
ncbi:unnamed protein product [Amoebophrya sp. A120]|nr:unnamed protein product [Amoebophrya sp. A120]|eukprot:GSA120T00020673001.1